jgi:hypothetical protein
MCLFPICMYLYILVIWSLKTLVSCKLLKNIEVNSISTPVSSSTFYVILYIIMHKHRLAYAIALHTFTHGVVWLLGKSVITFVQVVLLSMSWLVFLVLNQLYFNATDPLSELWRRAWVIPSFWNVLSYVLLAIICALWSPSRNPTGYSICYEVHRCLIWVKLFVWWILCTH